MPIARAILVFVVVALNAFVIFSLLDERKASCPESYASSLPPGQETAEDESKQELGLERDERATDRP